MLPGQVHIISYREIINRHTVQNSDTGMAFGRSVTDV